DDEAAPAPHARHDRARRARAEAGWQARRAPDRRAGRGGAGRELRLRATVAVLPVPRPRGADRGRQGDGHHRHAGGAASRGVEIARAMSPARVQLLHWKEAEGRERARELRAAGLRIEYEVSAQASLRAAREEPPAAIVIDLTRL